MVQGWALNHRRYSRKRGIKALALGKMCFQGSDVRGHKPSLVDQVLSLYGIPEFELERDTKFYWYISWSINSLRIRFADCI